MSERAIELLELEGEEPRLILDIGCGSGLSGEALDDAGHIWIGLDISTSMLSNYPSINFVFRPRTLVVSLAINCYSNLSILTMISSQIITQMSQRNGMYLEISYLVTWDTEFHLNLDALMVPLVLVRCNGSVTLIKGRIILSKDFTSSSLLCTQSW